MQAQHPMQAQHQRVVPQMQQCGLHQITEDSQTQARPYFTPDQCQQVVHMLDQGTPDGSSSSKTTIGIVISLVSKYMDQNWIIDTGASNHMTSNKSILKNSQVVP